MDRVTMQDIAKAVGVTKMTVSNAYWRPEKLSVDLRTRILATAEGLGYSGPNAAARALARGRTGVVGVLLQDSPYDAFADEVSVAFMAALSRTLSTRSLSILLLAIETGPDFEPARDVAMDAVLIYGRDRDSPPVTRLLTRRLPTVFVDRGPVEGTGWISVDNRGGASAAVDHLVSLGHRTIAAICPGLTAVGEAFSALTDDQLPPTDSHVLRRLEGWADPIGADQLLVFAQPETLTRNDGRRIGRSILEMTSPPSAIVCFSDRAAAGVIDAAQELGMAVPDDVSIIGFDDAPLAATTAPPLTTVRQDPESKGRAAAEALLGALDADSEIARVELPTHLIVRQSTSVAAR